MILVSSLLSTVASAGSALAVAAKGKNQLNGGYPKIINGDDVDHCDYEFMCSMIDSSGSWYGCGCALIAPNKVLTAAHCLPGHVGPSDFKVLIGPNSVEDPSKCNAELIEVASIDRHSQYDDW